MKECPVCKESFQDDLNFCDLDGSPLEGGAEDSIFGSSSKVWSFLGIALLLAAVGITAGAIIFFPRGPSATLSTGGSQSGTAGSAQPSTTAPDAGRAQPDAAEGLDRSLPGSVAGDATASASPDQTRPPSRKAGLSKNDNSDASLPNPKSVVGSDDELTRAATRTADETRPRTANQSAGADNGSSAKGAASDSGANDSAARPPATTVSAKRRSRTQAARDDASANENKNDKKKGGFLKVFKKIFGHG